MHASGAQYKGLNPFRSAYGCDLCATGRLTLSSPLSLSLNAARVCVCVMGVCLLVMCASWGVYVGFCVLIGVRDGFFIWRD